MSAIVFHNSSLDDFRFHAIGFAIKISNKFRILEFDLSQPDQATHHDKMEWVWNKVGEADESQIINRILSCSGNR